MADNHLFDCCVGILARRSELHRDAVMIGLLRQIAEGLLRIEDDGATRAFVRTKFFREQDKHAAAGALQVAGSVLQTREAGCMQQVIAVDEEKRR